MIWDKSPFGCAFFDHGGQEQERAANEGLHQIDNIWISLKQSPYAIDFESAESLYARIWIHLYDLGKIQQPPDVLRKRMMEAH